MKEYTIEIYGTHRYKGDKSHLKNEFFQITKN